MDESLSELPFDILHIGFPKSASTYLQLAVFPSHPEVAFSWRDHNDLFFQLRNYSIDFDEEEFVKRLRDRPVDPRKTKAKVRLFSAESLSGHDYNGIGARHILDTLARVMPEVRILLVLREQHSYIASAWNAYVQEGGTLGLRGFLTEHASPAVSFDIPRGKGGQPGNNNIFTHLCYADYVKYAQSKFGEDRVKVVFFEDLRTDRDRFFTELFDFLGVDISFRAPDNPENVSFSPPWLHFHRYFNRFCQTQYNGSGFLPYSVYSRSRWLTGVLSRRFPVGRKPSARDVVPLVPGWARERWQQSNRELGAIVGRDLGSLGYVV